VRGGFYRAVQGPLRERTAMNQMVRGIGVDITSVERISRWISRYDDETLAVVFTQREQEGCLKSTRPEQAFATCMAGKEAVAKTIGTGFAGVAWTEIEICLDGSRPVIRLHGEAQRRSLALGIDEWWLEACHLGRRVFVTAVALSKGYPHEPRP
jgi:holo-[acyl-carrier protein] synthase